MVDQNRIQELIGETRSDEIEAQRDASLQLGRAGANAVEPLIEALAASDENDQRWYLAVALARIGLPAVEPLSAALRARRDPEFRRYAAAALAEFGEDAVEPLVEMLEVEDDPELRGFAAQALVRIGDPAIDRLREAVEAGGTLGAVAGLVLWRMEEPGVQALAGVYCPDGDASTGAGDATDQGSRFRG